jgi:hypothetical protein
VIISSSLGCPANPPARVIEKNDAVNPTAPDLTHPQHDHHENVVATD